MTQAFFCDHRRAPRTAAQEPPRHCRGPERRITTRKGVVMSRQLMPALAACALISMPAAVVHAQEVQQSAPIVSRDAASRVSAFSYEKGPESELLLRGTTITPLAEGEVEVEYQEGRSEVDASVKKLPDALVARPVHHLRPLGSGTRWPRHQSRCLRDVRWPRQAQDVLFRVALRTDRHGGTAFRRDGTEHRARGSSTSPRTSRVPRPR